MIEAGTRLAASPRQISTRLEGEAVILDTTDGVYYGLDRVGARVWELLQEATFFFSLGPCRLHFWVDQAAHLPAHGLLRRRTPCCLSFG